MLATVLAVACAVRPPVACSARSAARTIVRMGYVPDGLSPAEWERMKKAEREKNANLGRVGVDSKRFKSRSMKSFMEALEKGEGGHLFPVNPQKVKTGEIPLEKVPYMQRKGGSWDNSDVRGAKKMKWFQSDKDYAAGGYKEYQSTSILGKGAGLPWTSNAVNKMDSRGESKATADMKKQWARMGVKTDKNGNPIQSSAKQVVNEGKKKLFGLF